MLCNINGKYAKLVRYDYKGVYGVDVYMNGERGKGDKGEKEAKAKDTASNSLAIWHSEIRRGSQNIISLTAPRKPCIVKR